MNVGIGILNKMVQEGDHPLRDSIFITNSDGSSYEQCVGMKGVYIASNASGVWEVAFFPGFLVP